MGLPGNAEGNCDGNEKNHQIHHGISHKVRFGVSTLKPAEYLGLGS